MSEGKRPPELKVRENISQNFRIVPSLESTWSLAMATESKLPVYLDYNATTPVDRVCRDAILPFFDDFPEQLFGNASSGYLFGQKSRANRESSRAQVASAVGAQSNEIFFTSCATESINWAIRGSALALKAQLTDHMSGKPHIVTFVSEFRYLDSFDAYAELLQSTKLCWSQ